MTPEDILKAALQVPEADRQLYCEHDKVKITREGTDEYADCVVCGKDITEDYDWFRHHTDRHENMLLVRGNNL